MDSWELPLPELVTLICGGHAVNVYEAGWVCGGHAVNVYEAGWICGGHAVNAHEAWICGGHGK